MTEISLDDNSRPPTPFSMLRPSNNNGESCDEQQINELPEANLSNVGRYQAEAWHHFPKLVKDDDNDSFINSAVKINSTKPKTFYPRTNEDGSTSSKHNLNYHNASNYHNATNFRKLPSRVHVTREKTNDVNEVQNFYNPEQTERFRESQACGENNSRVINVQTSNNTFSTNIKATFSFDIKTSCVDDGLPCVA